MASDGFYVCHSPGEAGKGANMRRMAFVFIVAAAGSAAVACMPALRAPGESDVRRAVARWPDATLGQLERGRKVYTAKCSGCHNLHLPSSLPPAAWPTAVDAMVSAYAIRLERSDREAMLRYLVTMSEKTRAEKDSGLGSNKATVR